MQLGTHPILSMHSGSAARCCSLVWPLRCSDVDQHWLILKQAQIAIIVLLILPKLVIEEILLQTLPRAPHHSSAQLIAVPVSAACRIPKWIENYRA